MKPKTRRISHAGVTVTVTESVDDSVAYRLAEAYRAWMLAEPTLIQATATAKWEGV